MLRGIALGLVASVVGCGRIEFDTIADADVVSASGCSDGEREGFVDVTTHPMTAGCAGGWSVPGLRVTEPACARVSGDDSANPDGAGCTTADLCAEGWHVCRSAVEVEERSPTGCNGAVPGGDLLMFASAQSGPGGADCNDDGTDDFFGCGTLGIPPDLGCGVLDRLSGNRCLSVGAPWECSSNQNNEVNIVVKADATRGGVLCCRD